MKVELKESEDKGFIIDLFDNDDNLLITKTYWYEDLEEKYREYLRDMANDEGAEVDTIESWLDWITEEKELLKERIMEEAK